MGFGCVFLGDNVAAGLCYLAQAVAVYKKTPNSNTVEKKTGATGRAESVCMQLPGCNFYHKHCYPACTNAHNTRNREVQGTTNLSQNIDSFPEVAEVGLSYSSLFPVGAILKLPS